MVNIAYASTVFNDWVEDGETFKAADHSFYVKYIESSQKLNFKMDDTGGMMLIGECETRESIKYCFEDVNLPQVRVKIESLEPDISIQRSFSTTTPSLNEQIQVTVILVNNGDKGATNVKYTDSYPSGLRVFSATNAGEWTGILSAGEEEKFTYSIKAEKILSYNSVASLSYQFDGKEKTKKSDAITINVQKPFIIDQKISTEAAEKEEIIDYNITITNKDESTELTVETLDIEIPSQITLVKVTDGLKKEDNKLIFSGTIGKKESKTFLIKLKSSKVGKFTIKYRAEVKLSDKSFEEESEKSFSVGLSDIIPSLKIPESVESNMPYNISITVKNYGKDEIKNVKIKVQSDLFTNIEETKDITAGSTYEVFKKTLTAPYMEEDKEYSIKVSGSYLSSAGKTYQFEESAKMKVTAAPKILQIIRELNKEEFKPGDEIKITVKVKNQKSTAIEQIDVSDVFPKEIRSSLLGDVTGFIEKLDANEEEKAYSYSVVVPEDYKDDKIEFKTTVNARINGELKILKRIDNLNILKEGEQPEEDEGEETEIEEGNSETGEKTAEIKEENVEKTETSKENFFNKLLNWFTGLFKK